MMWVDPYHSDEDGGALGAAGGVAIRARLGRTDARLDWIKAAIRRMAPLPGVPTPHQGAIRALQDELAALRHRFVISDDGHGI